ncbi:hypothetical protein C1H46_042486 [Malus baccata]|uniref:Uncharacterized protein n=1 Tax=Malus baccata TaxID=106549 RepID=A0A540KCP8_MALBA|nr:hypothetical protein C1H46_042486 [Malus baccata]
MHEFTHNQDVVMSKIRSEEGDNKDKFRSLVVACHAVESASMSDRPTIRTLSPRKRVCDEDAAGAGPSSYLNELD